MSLEVPEAHWPSEHILHAAEDRRQSVRNEFHRPYRILLRREVKPDFGNSDEGPQPVELKSVALLT